MKNYMNLIALVAGPYVTVFHDTEKSLKFIGTIGTNRRAGWAQKLAKRLKKETGAHNVSVYIFKTEE